MNILKRLAKNSGGFGPKLSNEKCGRLAVELLEDRVLLAGAGGLDVYWSDSPYSPTAPPAMTAISDGGSLDFNDSGMFGPGILDPGGVYSGYLILTATDNILEIINVGLENAQQLPQNPWNINIGQVPETIQVGEYKSMPFSFNPTVLPSTIFDSMTSFYDNVMFEYDTDTNGTADSTFSFESLAQAGYPAPEIDVYAGGASISDGQTTPVNMGPLDPYPNSQFQVEISNNGDEALFVDPPTFSGLGAYSIFSVNTDAAPWMDGRLSIDPGYSETITVMVNTSDFMANGTYDMSIPSDDGDENPFDFPFIFSNGPQYNAIDVTYPGGRIEDGQTSINLGSAQQGQSPLQFEFTVTNNDYETSLGSLSVPGGYTVVDPLVDFLGYGESDNVILSLPTAQVGSFGGTVEFSYYNSQEGVFGFQISASITAPPALAPPEIAMSYQGSQIADGQTIPLDLGSYDYNAYATPMTFTVTNYGDQPLSLGVPSLPDGFSMGSNSLVSSLASGASDTFTVQLDTSMSGTLNGQIVISNNDSNENPFNFAITAMVQQPPAPELDVYDGNSIIIDGQTNPVTFQDTFCGDDASFVTFTLMNSGNDLLRFDSFSVPSGFGIVSDLPGTLQPGTSAELTVELITSTPGLKQGQIIITSNDADENPFNFTVSGIVCAPEIAVSHNDSELYDGQAEPVNFGTVMPGAVSSYTFMVHNQGDAPLMVASLSLPNGFYVVEPLADTIAAGGSDEFTVGMTTATPGSFGGSIIIANNDSDENPFSFPVTGEVAASEIAVFLGDDLINDGATTPLDFGEANQGHAADTLTFTVRNLGNAPLSLGDLTLPDGLLLVESLVTELAPGAADDFSVRLDTAIARDVTGQISFANNDNDENPFNFAVKGQVFGHVPSSGNYIVLPDEASSSYVLVTLSGPGQLDIFTSPNNPLRVESVIVTGSTSASMLRAMLVGAGTASVGDIQVDGSLGMAMLHSVSLTGTFAISNTIDAMFLDDVDGEASVSAGNWSAVGTTVLAQDIADGAAFNIPGRINLFRAASFGSGSLTAGCFQSIMVVSGDFDVDVTAELGNISSLIVSQGDITGRILAAYDVGRIINSGGSFGATLRARRLDLLVSKDMNGAFVSVAERAGVVLLRQDVADSHVLIGYDIGIDGQIDSNDQLGSGQMRFFSYGGNFANSHLALGVIPSHSPLFADSGTSSGQVTDPSSAYIIGAKVTADNNDQLFGLYYDSAVGSTLRTALRPDNDFVIVDSLTNNNNPSDSDPGGVGAISFTLTWNHNGSDAGPDIDLHVIDPQGTEWDYSDEMGGHFDYDDQGAGGNDAEDDGNGPERAYWENDTALAGEYEFFAQWYDYDSVVTDATTANVALNVYQRQTGGQQTLVASYNDILTGRTDETLHWKYILG